MAKKKADPAPPRASTVVPPRLPGLTFAFSEMFRYGSPEEVTRLIEAEGGRVVDEVAAGVDYLIVGWPKRGHESDAIDRARRRYKALGDSLRIVDERDFYQLLMLTRDEALALLAGGQEGHDRWKKLTANLYHPSDRHGGIDLSEADFRGADLRGVNLDRVKLEGNDFSGADLSGGRCESAVRCKFDGATMRDATISRSRDCSFRDVDLTEGTVYNAEGCTFDGARITDGGFTEKCPRNSVKGVDLSDTRFNPANVSGCDFTGSKLCRVDASYSVAQDAIFRDADLTGAEFDESRFERSDFTGADLSKADLKKCNFTGAILRKARLAGADLRGANLTGADLRDADFRKATLADADLRGATIDGADFEDANVFQARLDGLDPGKARNLARERDKSLTTVGPRMRELAKVARSSARLSTVATVDLPGGESARLITGGRRVDDRYSVYASYNHFQPGTNRDGDLDARTFEQGMLKVANIWPKGQLRPDGIEVRTSKCPMRGAALLELATAAWREALGLPALSAEEFRRDQEALEAAREALGEALVAELRGGREGVEAWNARPVEHRRKVAPLRRIDLSGAELAGADLMYVDLNGARLDGARLCGAQLWGSEIKGASFRDADLSGANCQSCKGPGAVFEGATLAKCNLGSTGFRGANFRSANMKGAVLRSADLRGADFTGADLDGADLTYAGYDEQTAWPPGFEPPSTMRWKGKGPDPGADPSKVARVKGRRRST